MARQYDALLRQLEEKSQQLAVAEEEAASVGKARVDTALMKNMLMGYLIGPKNCQSDILRMMMSTLNFDERERSKVQSNQTSTLRSLFTAPLGKPHEPDDSFGNMLVKFIEQESKPKTGIAASGGPETPRESPQSRTPLAGLSLLGSSSSVPPRPPLVGLPLLGSSPGVPPRPPRPPHANNNSPRFYASASTRSNTATDPSMAQDRMLEDILNGPGEVRPPDNKLPSIDIV